MRAAISLQQLATAAWKPVACLQMPATISELEGLRATVDRVSYMPHLKAPADKPFPFVYFITIHNDSASHK